MSDFDILKLLASWSGMGLLVTALVQGAKRAFKKVEGNEAILSLVLGPILAVVAKASGAMTLNGGWSGWAVAIIGGLLVGVGGQVIHDKFWNPVSHVIPERKKDDKKEGDVA